MERIVDSTQVVQNSLGVYPMQEKRLFFWPFHFGIALFLGNA